MEKVLGGSSFLWLIILVARKLRGSKVPQAGIVLVKIRLQSLQNNFQLRPFCGEGFDAQLSDAII